MIVLCLFIAVTNAFADSPEGPSKDYVIGPEDVLDIQIWGNDDLRRSVEVSREGSFTFPLIGKVQAAGRSVFSLEHDLIKKLSKGYLVHPQVTVTVTTYKSQKVFVLGEVKKPGCYTIKGKTHILKIIAEAEGLTDSADRVVLISRPSRTMKEIGNGSAAIKETLTLTIDLDKLQEGSGDEVNYVFSGDSVTVNKAPPVYITGEVNKPGSIKWEKWITVYQAISFAGGPTSKGAVQRTRIIRTDQGREREIKPNLNDPVMPYDIIKVPQSYF